MEHCTRQLAGTLQDTIGWNIERDNRMEHCKIQLVGTLQDTIAWNIARDNRLEDCKAGTTDELSAFDMSRLGLHHFNALTVTAEKRLEHGSATPA